MSFFMKTSLVLYIFDPKLLIWPLQYWLNYAYHVICFLNHLNVVLTCEIIMYPCIHNCHNGEIRFIVWQLWCIFNKVLHPTQGCEIKEHLLFPPFRIHIIELLKFLIIHHIKWRTNPPYQHGILKFLTMHHKIWR